jgi:hypothetical protein
VSVVVVIAGSHHLAALRDRIGGADVLAFPDTEVLDALAAINRRRPDRVVLERQFAASARGTALVNRIKADPALASLPVDVVAHDEPATDEQVAPAAATPGRLRTAREDSRRRMREGVDIIVDGHAVRLVSLSASGAQVTSTQVLKPNQRVRVSLVDESGTQRFAATIVWAAYELQRPGRPGPLYRAELLFSHGDAAAIDAFARRHEAPPEGEP